MEWLNDPLVWAIDQWHQPMYLFPRDCPRILLWPTAETSEIDRRRYFGESTAGILAYIEDRWAPRLEAATIHRYELPVDPFESLGDAGMWVSRNIVRPLRRTLIEDLPAALQAQDVELRTLPVLAPLRDVWDSTLHASGIRLRNAREWGH